MILQAYLGDRGSGVMTRAPDILWRSTTRAPADDADDCSAMLIDVPLKTRSAK
jgi:hypothetical protein